MAERSFVAREIEDLWKGEGDVFTGEGILAITKARMCSISFFLPVECGAVERRFRNPSIFMR